jgi:hypothetical protein
MASWAALVAVKPTEKKGGGEGKKGYKKEEKNNSWRLGVKERRHSTQEERGRHQHVLPLDVWIHIAGLLEVRQPTCKRRTVLFLSLSSALLSLSLFFFYAHSDSCGSSPALCVW